VAKLAGIPEEVIVRARGVLNSLEVTHTLAEGAGTAKRGKIETSRIPARKEVEQLALFKEFVPHPAVDSLRELKIDAMSPLQAFDALRQLQELVAAESSASKK
jgi:DNA mismatch repair ATPase MutS